MSEKVIVPVAFEGLADNERLIFKLIFSVSERTKNRTYQYSFAAENHTGPSLLITGSALDREAEPKQLVIQLCDRDETASGPAIHRPLIATRVLSTLDRLVEEFHALLNETDDRETQTPQSEAQDDLPEAEQSDESLTEAADGYVEFSISEEEASELAIVHDDSLSNPANREEQQIQSEAADMDMQSTGEGLPQEEPVRDNDAASAYPVSDQAQIQTALVVDDSASVRKQLEIELDLFEVSVDYAEDAERALDLLAQKKYDVAFLDVVLPDQDGFSICKKIKVDKESKSTKVIMLTGKASHADKVRGSLAGCDAYLVKPVGRTTFQSTVKKFLKPIENIQVMEA